MTRIDHPGSSVWSWVLMLALMSGCVAMGVSKYVEFTTMSHDRGCVSSQNSIDKTVGVWEAQFVALPTDRDVWIELGTDGRVTRVSPDLAAWQKTQRVPEKNALAPGATVLFEYNRDESVFACVERLKLVTPERLRASPEVHYRFIQSAKPCKELRGRKRGTLCLLYGELGPRGGEPHTPH
jgi:hypothetical protein